jgi:predicted phage terminase large subunit-like protein
MPQPFALVRQSTRGIENPQQRAAIMMARRLRARKSLAEFSMSVDIPGKPFSDADDEWQFHPIETAIAEHHRLIMSAVEGAVYKDNGRVMLMLPPGSAKSTYASVVAPPFFMGKHPGFRVIAASYGSDLSRKLGRRARSIIRCAPYGKIFGALMAEDTRAALEWHLSNGSEYLGGGILSGLGGSRCEFLVIDDPVKNRQDADSKAIKIRTREEFEDTLEPRLVPGGAICLIMTRWAEDDLAGGILPIDWDGESGMISCRDGREWNVVRVPAECDRPDDPLGRKLGEGLWSSWFKPGHWDRFKLVKRTWNSLYQQVPRASDAGFFSREWFSVVNPNEIPRMIKVCRRWDLAASEGEGDFTAGVLMGIDADRNVWILDAVHFQKGPGKAEREMKRVTEQDDAIFKGRCRVVFPREPGAAGKILARHFAIQYAKFDHGFHIESRAKHIRARPLAAGLESGTVFLRAGEWNSILIDELCAFDESISEAHGDQIDDLVDAASGAYHELVGRKRSVVGAGPSVG